MSENELFCPNALTSCQWVNVSTCSSKALYTGNSILEHPKCQNFKDIFPSSLVHIWTEDTLKCSVNNLLKVYSVVNRGEAVDFLPMKTLKK